MTELTLTAPKKSTTVRPVPAEVAWLRRGLRLLGMLAPGLADGAAAALFFRPRRSAKAKEPEVPGLAAQSFTVESRGQTLRVWSWGEGPAVLLPHGWEGWAGQMVAFVPPLVAQGFRAVAFDMPAHGLSSGSSVSVLDMAHALGKVARACAPVHALVGHSMGGTAAALALAEGLRAEKAVLLAPGAEPSYFARRSAAFLGLAPARTEGMLRKVLSRFGGSWVETRVPHLVGGMGLPLLVLHDPLDDDVPWEHGQSIAAAWPRATIEPVAGVGHRRILRDPAVIARVVDFLGPPAA